MRKHAPSFEELVLENKKQLLQDQDALNKIEKRIEERKAKEFDLVTTGRKSN
ncbi:FbpB family small basic protein [Alkalihalobacterium sp. APHAB7]|uniref:FbpB family small basic protein n=1 Tax=Alkalihalobacterium sp. APHAB7 TaxID=3402081 RepID=UPI003AAA854F